MSNRYISINQELFREEDAKILVSDLAIQRGYGIFDFLKTIDHQPIFIENHFDRFYNSAKEMNLPVQLSRTELMESISKLMEKNNMPNSGLKFILTGGFSEDGYRLGDPNLIITQVPFEINPSLFNQGLKLVTYPHQRQLPSIKTIDYLQAIRLQSFIKENGAEDVLYHKDGALRECPRANFFLIKGKEISTPKSEILKGITRSKILALHLEGFQIVEKELSLSDIATADEAFICSSTKNVLPVLAIDGKLIGNGTAGNVSKKISDLLTELIKAEF